MREILPGFQPWPQGERYPTWARQCRNAKTNWYVRMAYDFGLVPHPNTMFAVADLMAALYPRVFRSRKKAVHYARRRPFHLVEPHWKETTEIEVRLPDTGHWLRLVVAADTYEHACKHALSTLPRGTRIAN